MRRLRSLGVLVSVLLMAALARGQDGGGNTDDLTQGEVSISCPNSFGSSIGVGGMVRSGELAGIRLVINDSAAKPREVLIRAVVKDADGDRVMWERSMTTNPGTAQPLWMYLRLPGRFDQSSAIMVTAFAAVEESGAATGGSDVGKYGAGKVLGEVRLVRPRTTGYRTDSMMAIVGNRTMGLRGYETNSGQWLIAGHERTQVISGMTPEMFPDRWMGLAQFETIVWNEGAPSLLGQERAAALREWVQRGGHLVVVLPRVGQAWTDEVNNPLFDIVPRVTVERREGVDLAPYHDLIDRSDKVTMPGKEVLQTFAPLPEAQPDEAVCVLAGVETEKGREWLVARRIVGTGMVTVIGLDAASRWMDQSQRGGPDPELFWHRVLGRRGEIVTQKRLEDPTNNFVYMRARDPLTYDSAIPALIAKTGQAAAGVALGFVVFILYWLIAGPLGFAALKKTGMSRHGWVVFLGAAGVFTAVAWGGATLIRPARTEARHLTFIDHVYGQTIDHARTWMSLLVPGYGEATIVAGDPASRERSRFHNVIAPWEEEGADTTGFPDARGYRIECKAPDQTTIPTRATVKQLQVDWAGAPPWKMPRPLSGDPKDKEGAIRIADDDAKSHLTGSLVHDLPGPLTDVVIVVVKEQTKILRGTAGAAPNASLLANVFAYQLPDPWKPGAENPVNLEVLTQKGPAAAGVQRSSGIEYFHRLLEEVGTDDQGAQRSTGDFLSRRLTGMALFSQIEPPDVKTSNSRNNYGFNNNNAHGAQRKYLHGMDLGRWFTEPCVIIIGHLGATEDRPSPTPLYLLSGSSSRPLDTAGRTVVRWVYPLGSRPPALPKPGESKEPAEPTPKEDGGGS